MGTILTPSRGPRPFRLWFASFIRNLSDSGNKAFFRNAMSAQRGFNPAFVCFVLYFVANPGKGRTEVAADKGRARAKELRLAARHLRKCAKEIRNAATIAFKPPFGIELRDLVTRSDVLHTITTEESEKAAVFMEQWAAKLDAMAELVERHRSGRRSLRAANLVLLWLHLKQTLPSRNYSAVLSYLLDAAYEASGQRGQIKTRIAISMAVRRYKQEYPNSYSYLLDKAAKNKDQSPAEEAALWKDLDEEDCRIISKGIEEMVVREEQRSLRW